MTAFFLSLGFWPGYYLLCLLSRRLWIESAAPRPDITPRVKAIKNSHGLPRSGGLSKKMKIIPMLPKAARKAPIDILFSGFMRILDSNT
jgi:hypothetical protein